MGKYDNLSKALRCCASPIPECLKCPFKHKDDCFDEIKLQAADAIEELSKYLAEYQEALDKANEKLAYLSGDNRYYYDLTYGRDQLKSYVDAMVYAKLHSSSDKALSDLVKQAEPRWIPVEEKLPEENGFYLCCYEAKHRDGVAMDEGLSILQYLDQKWHLNEMYIVTHWMPLPEPPREGT